MPTHLDWQEIALRLMLTAIAGTLVGLDRGEHGRPAGLRTTLLVCLAAAISMIQTNLLLTMAGRTNDSFVTLDLVRLPLGILTGMGFGAGAILRCEVSWRAQPKDQQLPAFVKELSRRADISQLEWTPIGRPPGSRD